MKLIRWLRHLFEIHQRAGGLTKQSKRVADSVLPFLI